MYASRRQSAGFTLIEVMTVIVFLSVAVAMVLPYVNPGLDQQMLASARVLASELDYARNLAMVNNSKYRLTIDFDAGQMTLEHTGSNSALDTLPTSSFGSSADTTTKKITRLASLPGISTSSAFLAMYADSVLQADVTTIEFGSLGATTRSEETFLVMSIGSGTVQRTVTLTVNPVTGLVTIGDVEDPDEVDVEAEGEFTMETVTPTNNDLIVANTGSAAAMRPEKLAGKNPGTDTHI